ncbi:hypothetical protein VF14_31865 [Nostoc linckia z18]|uniref:Uncharacterized protein n=2 Tax=Nostoc linckia TaxID=92942 RepID=A0A9Q5Z5U8_NOSLI|nr:hypothetical protein [Nostoc linckia]PHK34622.1 hypothetical protein VF12_23615 [Nostoc linckia z15]PHK41185.1 hypothetical protein VF13_31720 [Nostoc linckia z16]PHJ55793.1 hypothetical protein VF02_35480 [Nostoc linckia z1]PHJ57007.1 hypothetical protein VF05_36500 [Nostoc linckia z3]PHJ58301.1 hypothetical protein VF03_35685 [Nostoc linckia z2]
MIDTQITEEIALTIKGLKIKPITITFNNSEERIINEFVTKSIFKIYEHGINHFMRDKWGNKPPIENQKLYKDTKVLGLFISSLYELCKECFFIAPKSRFNSYQNNGIEWFGACLRDLIYIEISDCLNPEIKSKPKLDYLQIKKDRLKQLKDIESIFDTNIFNVYNPYLKFENCESLYLLIELSQKLAGIKPNFDKKYWTPFINSYRNAIAEIEKNYITVQLGIDDKGVWTKSPLEGSRNHSKNYLLKR